MKIFLVWDVIIGLGTLCAAVLLPAQLAFGFFPWPDWAPFDWLLTGLFAADIVVNFKRPFTQKGQRITKPSAIRRCYLSTWFFIDLLAAIPFNIIMGAPVLVLLRLLKLPRLIWRLHQRRGRQAGYSSIYRLVTFAFIMGLTAHWLACGWSVLGGQLPSLNKSDDYIHALYWCVTTLTTVGYGDVTPTTSSQMIYTMLVMILGVGMYGYIIGNLANMLANIDMAKAHYLSNMERLSTFLKYRKIPPIMQQRVYEYYTYLWENRMGYDETALLSQLPASLQAEVSLVLKKDFIEKVPFLKGASQEFVRDLAIELRPVIFSPGTYIFMAGEIGRHLYFINRGSVQVINADGDTIRATLGEGDFFGEIALIASQPRSASIKAIEYCDMYSIDKDTFDRVLSHYPYFAKHIKEMMAKRLQESGPPSQEAPEDQT